MDIVSGTAFQGPCDFIREVLLDVGSGGRRDEHKRSESNSDQENRPETPYICPPTLVQCDLNDLWGNFWYTREVSGFKGLK